MGNDPMTAREMIRKSENLSPQARAGLENAVRGEVYAFQAREAAEQAMERFGGLYDDADGIAWLRKSVENPEVQDLAVSRYSALKRERDLNFSLQDEERRKAQNKNEEEISIAYANGDRVSDDRLNEMYESGEISGQAAARFIYANQTEADYGLTLQKLKDSTPNWDQLSQNEKDALVMRSKDTDAARHQQAVDELNAGLGTYTTDEIVKDYVKKGLITNSEAVKFIAAVKGYDAKNKASLEGIKAKVTDIIDPEKKSSLLEGMYPGADFIAMMGDLDAYIATLSAEKDPDIVEKVGVRAQTIMSRAIEKAFKLNPELDPNGTQVHDIPWIPQPWGFSWGFGRREPAPYSEAVIRARTELEEITALGRDARNLVPAVKAARIRIPGAYEDNVADISTDILGGRYTMTSGYTAKRRGRSAGHQGLDYAAPIGTPVKAPGVLEGGDFTVTAVKNNQNGSRAGTGNSVTVSGVDVNGSKVEWTFNHLNGVDPALAVGMKVTPGMSLGQVGNTGYVEASPGGNGAHLDLKLKVNGRSMDPARYYAIVRAADENSPGEQAGSAPPAAEEMAAMTDDELMDYWDSFER
jgi:murein DD-endopeptidase MepM/ murein hydrolase activator NlpD